MTKTKSKRAILISALIIILSVAVLTATTLAWFSDTETNTGNIIVAGELDITATWYDATATTEGTTSVAIDDDTYYFATTGTSFTDAKNAMIDISAWSPSATDAKLIVIENKGNLDATLTLDAIVTENALENALWYDFVTVVSAEGTTDYTNTGTFAAKPMSTLAALVSSIDNKITVAAGSSVQFVLVYGMNAGAGNEYQGLEYELDIIVTASQVSATVVYAETIADITNAAAGSTIVLLNDITDSEAELALTVPVNIDLNGYTLTVKSLSITVSDSTIATVGIAEGYIVTDSGAITTSGALTVFTIADGVVSKAADTE